MGARKFVLPKIRHLVPFRIPLGDISRPGAFPAGRGLPCRAPGGAGAHRARGALLVDGRGAPSRAAGCMHRLCM